MRIKEIILRFFCTYAYIRLHFKNWSCEMLSQLVHFIANVPRQTSLSLRENRTNEERRSVKGSFGRTNAHGVPFEPVEEYCEAESLRCAQVAARNLTLIVVIPPEK